MVDHGPSRAQLMSAENPVINGTGDVSFGKNHYCVWHTTDGSTSICSIQNTSVKNTLTFVVSGAPESIYTIDGSKFNGQHALPPNQPTKNVTALGDFQGQQVSIFNMSTLDTPCNVSAYAPSSSLDGRASESIEGLKEKMSEILKKGCQNEQ